MADYTLEPRNTLVVGMTGSGKTTFAIRYLLNVATACRFIFDDLGRFAKRLDLIPARTLNECEAAVASRWVVYNPHTMFPGKPKNGFNWFCEWVYKKSKQGPGHKVFCVDEVWQWQDGRSVPDELLTIATTGREEGIELMTCTQYPHWTNASLTGSATELVAFKLCETDALDEVKRIGLDKAEVAALPLGKFIALNRLLGQKLSAKLF